MSTSSQSTGTQAIYDFWLDLIPQFFGQFGAGMPTEDAQRVSGLGFPADQVARAASMTQDALQNLARAYAPVLEAAGPAGLLGQWASAMPLLAPAPAFGSNGGVASPVAAWASMMPWLAGNPSPSPRAAAPAADPLGMIGPWAAMMPFFAGTQSAPGAPQSGSGAAQAMLAPWMAAMSAWTPGMTAATAQGAGATAPSAAMLPLQAMQKSWLDFSTRLVGVTPETLATGFDRTFGALGDALGFGPLRKLQTAYQDLVAAAVAQNDARMTYVMLVQSALVAGFEGLLQRLAAMAEAGERVDSLLKLLRLWAASTEQAVHGVLQSEPGLRATAALSRAGVSHRRKMQHIAGIVADTLDMATRSDLDEAYREIQNLKREVRSLRPPLAAATPVKARPRSTKRKGK